MCGAGGQHQRQRRHRTYHSEVVGCGAGRRSRVASVAHRHRAVHTRHPAHRTRGGDRPTRCAPRDLALPGCGNPFWTCQPSCSRVPEIWDGLVRRRGHRHCRGRGPHLAYPNSGIAAPISRAKRSHVRVVPITRIPLCDRGINGALKSRRSGPTTMSSHAAASSYDGANVVKALETTPVSVRIDSSTREIGCQRCRNGWPPGLTPPWSTRRGRGHAELRFRRRSESSSSWILCQRRALSCAELAAELASPATSPPPSRRLPRRDGSTRDVRQSPCSRL
jgi:hypothetical protein